MKYIKIINKNFYYFTDLLNTNLFSSELWIFNYKNIYIEIEKDNIDLNFLKKIYIIKYLWSQNFSNIEKLQSTKIFDKFFDIEFIETNSAVKVDKNSLLVTKDQFIFDQIYFRNMHKKIYLFYTNKIKKSKRDFEKHKEDQKISFAKKLAEINERLLSQIKPSSKIDQTKN
jgi:hypothetical protein